ncbi:HAD family hydrolase [Thermodesulfobacteriota bacterium]
MELKTKNILKAVIFDFGGVFAEEGFRKGLKIIAEKNNIDPGIVEKAGYNLMYTTGYVLGHGDEKGFWRAIKQETGIIGDNKELREIIFKKFKIRPWFPEIINKLKGQGLVNCILSDQTDWLDKLDERDNFYQWFDHIFNSFNIGKSKSDPELFDNIAGKLGLKPDKILFVDDYHGHIERAKKKGFNTHLFVDKAEFLSELKKYFDYDSGEKT